MSFYLLQSFTWWLRQGPVKHPIALWKLTKIGIIHACKQWWKKIQGQNDMGGLDTYDCLYMYSETCLERPLPWAWWEKNLSWETTLFWQDLHFNITEPVTRGHLSWQTNGVVFQDRFLLYQALIYTSWTLHILWLLGILITTGRQQ